MPTRNHLVILPLLLLLLPLAACMSLAEDITPPPGMQAPLLPQNTPELEPTPEVVALVYPNSAPDPNKGVAIYAEKCAACHGETGMGDGPNAAILENPIPALGEAALARKSTPSEWYSIVTQGNMTAFMPAFNSLSDQERWDVVAYLYTLSAPPTLIQQGAGLFSDHCAECHGDDGRQGGVDLTDQAFMSERSAEDMFATISTGQGQMPAFDVLSQDERWALAAYLRSLALIPWEGDGETGIAEAEIGSQEPELLTESVPEVGDLTPGIGDITVSVVSGPGESLPSNLEITLNGYDEMTEAYTRTLSLPENASVIFEGVPLILNRLYFATIEYANAFYGSDVISIENSMSKLNLEITYYPPNTDPSILQVERLHVFIDFADDKTLEIFQLYIFSNPTNQVLTPEGEDGTAVNFIIPPDSSNLYVEDNLNLAYRKTNDGFGIVNVYPNENPYQTVFSYQVPYDGRALDLSIPISMDVNAIIVMSPANGFKVKGDQLQDAGTRDLEGVPYSLFTAGNLNTGDTLDLALSGRPKGETSIITGSDSNTNLVIGLAGLGVALIAAGVFVWRRNRIEDDFEDGEEEDEFNGKTSEDLIDSIITLDDQYRTGGLPEGAYRQRRTALKEQLKASLEQES
jgi:mono/diheme cytochrome c family protein